MPFLILRRNFRQHFLALRIIFSNQENKNSYFKKIYLYSKNYISCFEQQNAQNKT